jgi:hypothetical protein
MKNTKINGNEVNNFERGQDPIKAMSIGNVAAIPIMCQEIMNLDAKYDCYVGKYHEKNYSIGGIIRCVSKFGSTLKIDIYSDTFVDQHNKEINKLEYAIDLINKVGLMQYLNYESLDKEDNVYFYIKPEFDKYFNNINILNKFIS